MITGDYTFDIHGRYVARIGDLTVCPKCKGTFPITTGAGNMVSMDQAPARDGDKTACGAVLISSLVNSTIDQGTTAGSDGEVRVSRSTVPGAESTGNSLGEGINLAEANALIAQETPTLCLDCLKKAAAQAATFVVRG